MVRHYRPPFVSAVLAALLVMPTIFLPPASAQNRDAGRHRR